MLVLQAGGGSGLRAGGRVVTDVKRLLEQATPLPWHYDGDSHSDEFWNRTSEETSELSYHLASLDRLVLDAVWHNDSTAGLYSTPADMALIVYAVNHLPDYEAAVDALQRLTTTASAMYDDWPTIDMKIGAAIDAARAALHRLRGES